VYKKFFNLNEDPFNVSPDPRFFCSTAEIEEAFTHVLSGIRHRKGLILLTGEVCTGKTILLKKLMDKLRGESTATAFVFNPILKTSEFFDYVLSDFGLAHDSEDKPRMVRVLHQWILERTNRGQNTVLIIDEAQDLPSDVLEEIRLLSNLETPSEKLLQIILSGQPEIEVKLDQPGLRLLNQRIGLRRRTHVLTLADASNYVAHRLNVAGGDVWTIFTSEAVASVYRFSQGIPRVINLLCQHALIWAYAEHEKPIGGGIIEEVAKDFGLDVNASPYQPLLDEAVKVFKAESVAHPPEKKAEPIPPPRSVTARPSTSSPLEISTRAEKPASARISAKAGFAAHPETGKGATPVPVKLKTPSSDVRMPKGGISPAEKSVRRPRQSRNIPEPIFSNLSVPATANIDRPKSLRWTLLILMVASIAFAGYSFWINRTTVNLPAMVSALAETLRPSTPPKARGQGQVSPQPAVVAPRENPSAIKPTPPPGTTKEESLPMAASASSLVGQQDSATQRGVLPAQQVNAGTFQQPPPPGGWLLVKSNVSGAAIILDGRGRSEWITPHTFRDLSAGSHKVIVSKPGYQGAERSVRVEPGREISLNAILTPANGLVGISTDPTAAEVFIDGKSYGPSPVLIKVAVGEHAFSVRQTGWESVSGTLTVRDQAVTTRNISLPPATPQPITANVEVITDPDRATVYVDGMAVPASTPTSFHMPPGLHTLTIFAVGYRPLRREIEVPASGSISINESLYFP